MLREYSPNSWCSYLNKTLVEAGKNKETLKVFPWRGVGHSLMAQIFAGLVFTCPPAITKKGDWKRMELTFFCLDIWLILIERSWNTEWTQCSFSILEKIRMSTSYTNTKIFRKSLRTSFTSARKAAGVLVRPNGITKYLKCLRGVLNVVFHSSSSLMRTRW